MNQIEFSEWPSTKRKDGIQSKIGVVRLNNPKALNSLTLEMVEQCAKKLMQWETDVQVSAVIFYSDLEKAFCAGGDVKTVVQKLNAGDPGSYSADFFRWEYKMDYLLQTYSKPILSWGDGIVMGGGMGIFCASSHRVVTPRTILAMPEINIGFFPDVGAGVFLNRLPRPVALFLAWTAARVNPKDALDLKLATHCLSFEKRGEAFEAIRQTQWSGHAAEDKKLLDAALIPFEVEPSVAPEIAPAVAELNSVFGTAGSARQLAFEFANALFSSTWLKTGQETFRHGSPTSALVSFEQLERAKSMSILDVFVMEWNIARHMCKRTDFREGVRARLIDKDNRPKWTPASIADVSDETINAHFLAFSDGGESEPETRRFFETRKI